jgi:hypothetical protein
LIFKEDKQNLYLSKKLDFKDEVLNKITCHTQYLFSDLILTSRNYLITYSDRYLTKFSLPDAYSATQSSALNNDIGKKQVIYFVLYTFFRTLD